MIRLEFGVWSWNSAVNAARSPLPAVRCRGRALRNFKLQTPKPEQHGAEGRAGAAGRICDSFGVWHLEFGVGIQQSTQIDRRHLRFAGVAERFETSSCKVQSRNNTELKVALARQVGSVIRLEFGV